MAHAERIGLGTVVARGVAAAEGMPDPAVYAGFSLGAMPAQKLAQTRPGALAAVLYHGAVPAAAFGDGWPGEVALQAHVSDRDPWGEPEEVVRPLVGSADGELFTYPGSPHPLTASSTGEDQPDATARVLERTLGLLGRWP